MFQFVTIAHLEEAHIWIAIQRVSSLDLDWNKETESQLFWKADSYYCEQKTLKNCIRFELIAKMWK